MHEEHNKEGLFRRVCTYVVLISFIWQSIAPSVLMAATDIHSPHDLSRIIISTKAMDLSSADDSSDSDWERNSQNTDESLHNSTSSDVSSFYDLWDKARTENPNNLNVESFTCEQEGFLLTYDDTGAIKVGKKEGVQPSNTLSIFNPYGAVVLEEGLRLDHLYIQATDLICEDDLSVKSLSVELLKKDEVRGEFSIKAGKTLTYETVTLTNAGALVPGNLRAQGWSTIELINSTLSLSGVAESDVSASIEGDAASAVISSGKWCGAHWSIVVPHVINTGLFVPNTFYIEADRLENEKTGEMQGRGTIVTTQGVNHGKIKSQELEITTLDEGSTFQNQGDFDVESLSISGDGQAVLAGEHHVKHIIVDEGCLAILSSGQADSVVLRNQGIARVLPSVAWQVQSLELHDQSGLVNEGSLTGGSYRHENGMFQNKGVAAFGSGAFNNGQVENAQNATLTIKGGTQAKLKLLRNDGSATFGILEATIDKFVNTGTFEGTEKLSFKNGTVEQFGRMKAPYVTFDVAEFQIYHASSTRRGVIEAKDKLHLKANAGKFNGHFLAPEGDIQFLSPREMDAQTFIHGKTMHTCDGLVLRGNWQGEKLSSAKTAHWKNQGNISVHSLNLDRLSNLAFLDNKGKIETHYFYTADAFLWNAGILRILEQRIERDGKSTLFCDGDWHAENTHVKNCGTLEAHRVFAKFDGLENEGKFYVHKAERFTIKTFEDAPTSETKLPKTVLNQKDVTIRGKFHADSLDHGQDAAYGTWTVPGKVKISGGNVRIGKADVEGVLALGGTSKMPTIYHREAIINKARREPNRAEKKYVLNKLYEANKEAIHASGEQRFAPYYKMLVWMDETEFFEQRPEHLWVLDEMLAHAGPFEWSKPAANSSAQPSSGSSVGQQSNSPARTQPYDTEISIYNKLKDKKHKLEELRIQKMKEVAQSIYDSHKEAIQKIDVPLKDDLYRMIQWFIDTRYFEEHPEHFWMLPIFLEKDSIWGWKPDVTKEFIDAFVKRKMAYFTKRVINMHRTRLELSAKNFQYQGPIGDWQTYTRLHNTFDDGGYALLMEDLFQPWGVKAKAGETVKATKPLHQEAILPVHIINNLQLGEQAKLIAENGMALVLYGLKNNGVVANPRSYFYGKASYNDQLYHLGLFGPAYFSNLGKVKGDGYLVLHDLQPKDANQGNVLPLPQWIAKQLEQQNWDLGGVSIIAQTFDAHAPLAFPFPEQLRFETSSWSTHSLLSSAGDMLVRSKQGITAHQGGHVKCHGELIMTSQSSDIDCKHGKIHGKTNVKLTASDGKILVGEGVPSGYFKNKNGAYIASDGDMTLDGKKGIEITFGEVDSKGNCNLSSQGIVRNLAGRMWIEGKGTISAQKYIHERPMHYPTRDLASPDWWCNRKEETGEAAYLLASQALHFACEEVINYASFVLSYGPITDNHNQQHTQSRSFISESREYGESSKKRTGKDAGRTGSSYYSHHAFWGTPQNISISSQLIQLTATDIIAAAISLTGHSILIRGGAQNRTITGAPVVSLSTALPQITGGTIDYNENPNLPVFTSATLGDVIALPPMPFMVPERLYQQLTRMFSPGSSRTHRLLNRQNSFMEMYALAPQLMRIRFMMDLTTAERALALALMHATGISFTEARQNSHEHIVTLINRAWGLVDRSGGNLPLISLDRIPPGADAFLAYVIEVMNIQTHAFNNSRVESIEDLSNNQKHFAASPAVYPGKKYPATSNALKGRDAVLAALAGDANANVDIHATGQLAASQTAFVGEDESNVNLKGPNVTLQAIKVDANNLSVIAKEFLQILEDHDRVQTTTYHKGGSTQHTAYYSLGSTIHTRGCALLECLKGPVTLQHIKIDAERAEIFSGEGLVQFLLGTNWSQTIRTNKNKNAFWQSMSQSVETHQTYSQNDLSGVQTLVIGRDRQGNPNTPGDTQDNLVRVLVEEVAGQTQPWIEKLRKMENAQNDDSRLTVSERLVQEIHTYTSQKSWSLTGVSAGLATLAITLCTQGTASAWASSLSANLGLTGGTAAVASGAVQGGIVGLASATGVSLLENEGNLLKTIDYITSSKTVRRLAESIVAGGVTGGLMHAAGFGEAAQAAEATAQTGEHVATTSQVVAPGGIPGAAPAVGAMGDVAAVASTSATASHTVTSHLARAAVRETGAALAHTALTGEGVDLAQSALNIAGSAAQSVGAQAIGFAKVSGTINSTEQVLLHAPNAAVDELVRSAQHGVDGQRLAVAAGSASATAALANAMIDPQALAARAKSDMPNATPDAQQRYALDQARLAIIAAQLIPAAVAGVMTDDPTLVGVAAAASAIEVQHNTEPTLGAVIAGAITVATAAELVSELMDVYRDGGFPALEAKLAEEGLMRMGARVLLKTAGSVYAKVGETIWKFAPAGVERVTTQAFAKVQDVWNKKLFSQSVHKAERHVAQKTNERTARMQLFGTSDDVNKAPYNARHMESILSTRYGSHNVTSSTLPKVTEKNVALAGKRHPITNIPFDERGLPVFDSVTIFEANISAKIALRGSDAMHKSAATRNLRRAIEANSLIKAKFNDEQVRAIMAGNPQIPGLTWHHHQDVGRLQLICKQTHKDTGHVGGASLWKRGN